MLGTYLWEGDTGLLNIVMIGLAKNLPEKEDGYNLHRLLGALFSPELKVDERFDILQNEFGITLEDDIGKDVNEMCNLGEGIREQAYAEAIVRIYKKGYSMEQISDLLDIEMEQIQNILKDKGYIQYV